MLIGLSLSFCIADIINGRVNRDDVLYIITGTRIRNVNEFNRVLDSYEDCYWTTNPSLGRKIATDFYNRGMLLQPRIQGGDGPAIFDGAWAKVTKEI